MKKSILTSFVIAAAISTPAIAHTLWVRTQSFCLVENRQLGIG